MTQGKATVRLSVMRSLEIGQARGSMSTSPNCLRTGTPTDVTLKRQDGNAKHVTPGSRGPWQCSWSESSTALPSELSPSTSVPSDISAAAVSSTAVSSAGYLLQPNHGHRWSGPPAYGDRATSPCAALILHGVVLRGYLVLREPCFWTHRLHLLRPFAIGGRLRGSSHDGQDQLGTEHHWDHNFHTRRSRHCRLVFSCTSPQLLYRIYLLDFAWQRFICVIGDLSFSRYTNYMMTWFDQSGWR